MTDYSAWFSPAVMRLLAWALLHFLWQGLVLGALFAALMAIARTAATRYALAVSILVLMVASPVATFLYLRQSSSNVHPVAAANYATAVHFAGDQASAVAFVAGWIWRRASPLTLSCGWSGSGLRASSFSACAPPAVWWWCKGCSAERRLRSAPRLLQTCLDLQRRVGIKRAIRFCQCNGLDVPAVIGWFRPVVLLPMTVLTGLSRVQLEAVIVHELSHIKRCDYFVNLFQIAAETLLFYHPAVWWVSGRIRQERENCCDDAAVRLCGHVVDYARALTYMEGGRTAPSLVMAASGSPLGARVMRLLGARKSGGSVLSAGLVAGTICLAGGVYLSQAFLRVAHADAKPVTAPTAVVQTTVVPKVVPVEPVSDKVPAVPAVRPVVYLGQLAIPAPAPAAMAVPTPATPPTPAAQATTADQASNQGSYIDSLKAEGLTNISVDDLVAMKIQGVTADYVRQLHQLGLQPGPDDLIAMKIQGVTPDYIRSMRASGITANADDLVAMKIQGVTPEYIRTIHDLGLKAGADDLVAMRIQGVTPEYIRDIRALGLNPNADDLVAMQIQGVTPAYIKALSAAGIGKTDADDYIAAKIQGITPEFIEKARQHGFNKLDLDQLIELKHAGVL